MEQTNYTTRVLTPSEGCWLTESKDVDITTRTLSQKVFLAANASADDWREITAEEAEEIRAAQEAAYKEEQ